MIYQVIAHSYYHKVAAFKRAVAPLRKQGDMRQSENLITKNAVCKDRTIATSLKALSASSLFELRLFGAEGFFTVRM